MILDKIFTSHMVFPANKPFDVYGEGKGKVTVKFNNVTKELKSNDEKWYIEFPPMTYGGPYTMEIDMAGEKTTLDDIYVGEVYLFAGQSNMQFSLCDSNTPKELYEDNDKIRIFSLPKHSTKSISYDDGWTYSTKENVADMSAIAYLVSRQIQKEKNIAVGVIVTAQGASTIESWVPDKSFNFIGEDAKFIDHRVSDYYWNKDGYLYENAFSLVKPFTVNAAIWYQGESDASEAEGKFYAEELATLIDTWRRDLLDEKLPFVVVQIADNEERIAMGEGWRLIQKAQLDIQNMRNNVKTVISKDICETDDIHPKTKDKLSVRIADTLLEGKC